jgi:2-methylcitrate dehydratase PrpD
LSAGAVRAVKNFVLDTIGVGIGGAGSLYAPKVRALGERMGAAGEIGVWGKGPRLAAPEAAFVNAFQAHCQEFDCVHEAAVLHPFTVVTPVILAEAGARGISGARFISAVSAGVDVAVALGAAARSQIRFFRPATCGHFGAVAALCHARGLSADQTVTAFGYALAFASGTMQAHVEGTPALAIQVAAAARNAFLAVDIAEAGLPGPKGAIDGPFGYLTLFEAQSDVEAMLADLPRERVTEVSWKPAPTGRAAHGGIELMQRLRSEGVHAEDIASIEIEATPLINHLVGRPIKAPLEVNYARLCLPYAAAVALIRGDVGLGDFREDVLQQKDVHALAARIGVTRNAVTDPAAFTPQKAIVRLNNGAEKTLTLETLLGTQARPLSRAQQEAKFRACAAFGGLDEANANALIEVVEGLETLDDAAVLQILAQGQDNE